MLFTLNLTQNDPKRALFQNKDFRIAFSHALNRHELIDIVWLGQGEPYQAARGRSRPSTTRRSRTSSPSSIAMANQMLDVLGLPRGRQRHPADERRPAAPIHDRHRTDPPAVSTALELIQGYWREMGVDLQINVPIRRPLPASVEVPNLYEAIWSASGGADTLFDPKYYFPSVWTALYSSPVATGTTGTPAPWSRSAGDEATEALRKLCQPTDAEGRLLHAVLKIARDEFRTFGILLPTTDYGIINNRLRNVPADCSHTDYPTRAPLNPEQVYFKRE